LISDNIKDDGPVHVWSSLSLRDGKASAELLSRLGLASVSEVVEKNRLRWFGHVEKKDVEDWVSRCRKLEVVGNRGRGRPRKSWQQCVDGDKSKHEMLRVDPWERSGWRKYCRINRPTHALQAWKSDVKLTSSFMIYI